MNNHSAQAIKTWLFLILITIASVVIAEENRLPVIVYLAAFILAIAKGQLVAIHFMETPRARPTWNTLYRCWIVGIGLILLLGNILSPRP